MRHTGDMLRPCFLVIDREYAGGISTRKLVIETAKFNVITAYSSHEAMATLRKYPGVDGVVLDAGMEDLPATELIKELKGLQPELPIVVVSAPGAPVCDAGDYLLESFEPVRLIALLQQIVPQQAAQVAERERELATDAQLRPKSQP